jgi:hypothetical protein
MTWFLHLRVLLQQFLVNYFKQQGNKRITTGNHGVIGME